MAAYGGRDHPQSVQLIGQGSSTSTGPAPFHHSMFFGSVGCRKCNLRLWVELLDIRGLRLVGMSGHVLHSTGRRSRGGANSRTSDSLDEVRATSMDERIVFRSDGRSQVTIGHVRNMVALLWSGQSNLTIVRLGFRRNFRRRGWWRVAGNGGLTGQELLQDPRNSRVVSRRVLPSQNLRRLVELLREAHQRHRVVLGSPFRVTRLRSVEDATREGQRCSGQVRRRLRHELAVEETDFQDIQRQVFNFRLVRGVHDGNLKKAVDSWVSDGPTQGLQDVPLHLNEHVIVIQRAAHRLQFPNGGHTILLVAILGSNKKSGTSNQLIMSLVNHALGAVSVQEVYGQEQRGREELEGGMGFNQEVQQVGTHEPLDLGLNIDRFHIREGSSLKLIQPVSNPSALRTARETTHFHVQHVRHNVLTELITGHPGQFIRDGILTFTGNKFGLFLGIHPGYTEVIVSLHEESVTGLVAGSRAMESHDVE